MRFNNGTINNWLVIKHSEMRKTWDLPPESAFRYTGPDWLPLLLANVSRDRRALVLLVLWRSWHLRNNVIHDKGDATIQQSVSFLNRYAQEIGISYPSVGSKKGKELILSNSSGSDSGLSVLDVCNAGKHRDVWTAPALGTLKINVDASFIQETGVSSFGCIAHDHFGKVIWACSRSGTHCQDVFEAEAKACLLGLQCMNETHARTVLMESDKVAVVNAIRSKNQRFSRLWHIFEEIEVLSSACDMFTIQKIGRESNKAAHTLAALARTSLTSEFWLGSVPPEIALIVAEESVNFDSDME